MPKGSWREFENTSEKKVSHNSYKTQSKAELPVRVQKTRVGKGGKTVTVITGLDIGELESKKLLKVLKAKCGTGGTFKEGLLELQGDQVIIALNILEKEGYQPKKSGG
ncbi:MULTISPECIES: translation initiation factor [Prochlorococcus]|uniref:translation initiation factor n=1 Tax=Prochlorococcus TaxID=1218 RepID=UPI000533B049|nr:MULTISPECIES: translation initiation factor [Prochlorococcus]KGG13208.1 Translation initiation factor SUI1-related protein [Prochlorococcus sp. MIT 0601]